MAGGMSGIELVRALHVELHYRVLAALDLGRDAASLYTSRHPQPAWAPGLRDAYLSAGRDGLQLQCLALRVDSLEAMIDLAQTYKKPLFDHYIHALEAESASAPSCWQTASSDKGLEQLSLEIIEPMTRLRAALWSRVDAQAPPLVIFDAPSLGLHGRGLPQPSEHRVAVSLAESSAHVFCQVFHEETHPISDRFVDGRAQRETRCGTDGHSLHLEIEQRAIALGAEIIDEVAPEYAPNYDQWRKRFGM